MSDKRKNYSQTLICPTPPGQSTQVFETTETSPIKKINRSQIVSVLQTCNFRTRGHNQGQKGPRHNAFMAQRQTSRITEAYHNEKIEAMPALRLIELVTVPWHRKLWRAREDDGVLHVRNDYLPCSDCLLCVVISLCRVFKPSSPASPYPSQLSCLSFYHPGTNSLGMNPDYALWLGTVLIRREIFGLHYALPTLLVHLSSTERMEKHTHNRKQRNENHPHAMCFCILSTQEWFPMNGSWITLTVS